MKKILIKLGYPRPCICWRKCAWKLRDAADNGMKPVPPFKKPFPRPRPSPTPPSSGKLISGHGSLPHRSQAATARPAVVSGGLQCHWSSQSKPAESGVARRAGKFFSHTGDISLKWIFLVFGEDVSTLTLNTFKPFDKIPELLKTKILVPYKKLIWQSSLTSIVICLLI